MREANLLLIGLFDPEGSAMVARFPGGTIPQAPAARLPQGSRSAETAIALRDYFRV